MAATSSWIPTFLTTPNPTKTPVITDINPLEWPVMIPGLTTPSSTDPAGCAATNAKSWFSVSPYTSRLQHSRTTKGIDADSKLTLILQYAGSNTGLLL